MHKLLVAALFAALIPQAWAQSPSDCETGYEALKKGDFGVAVEPLTKCYSLPLPPEARAEILQMRAHALNELGRHQEALIDQMQSLLLVKPEDVWPMVMLAVYHRNLKQYAEALSALKGAEKYDEDGPGSGPGMAVGYHTGWTMQSMGEHQRAVETFTAAIPKQPDYGWVFYRRALSYEALGDQAHAKEDMAKAYELIEPEGYESDQLEKFKEYGYKPKQKAILGQAQQE